MSDATNAVGQYANLVTGLKDRAQARKDSTYNMLGQALGQVGATMQQKQAEDALTKHLVEDLGGDPTRTKTVLATRDPAQIKAYRDELEATRNMRGAFGLLGAEAPASSGAPVPAAPAQAGTMETYMGGPASTPTTVPGIPAPGPSSSMSMVGGVQTPALPPTSPTAFPSRMDLVRRAMQMRSSPGAVETALKFLPREAAPVDPSEVKLREAQAREADARASALAHPQAKAVDPDDQPLTADQAAMLGVDAKYVGKVTFGQAKAAVGARGHQEKKDVAGYAKSKGVPYYEGMTFDDVDRNAKPATPQSSGERPYTAEDEQVYHYGAQFIGQPFSRAQHNWDRDHPDEQTKLLRTIAINSGQRAAADYEPPAHKTARENAAREYQKLLAESGKAESVLYVSPATGKHGKAALAADIAAAKATVDRMNAELGTLGGAPLANVPPPEPVVKETPAAQDPDAPTPEEVEALKAEGKRYDPATKTIVPLVPVNVR